MKFFRNLLSKGKPSVVSEISDRDTTNVSVALTPQKVAYIMKLADSGDIKDQCKLADELLEKNADIIQAFQTRVDAVVGVPWSLKPADDSPKAQEVAKKLTLELELINGRSDVDTFEEMIEDLVGAVLYGFSVSEILWENGGTVKGFNFIEQKRFTFHDSYFPKLITHDCPLGVEIPSMRILYHRHRRKGREISRSGLIRVLAWMHCFMNSNEKQLLSFIERYGMPFVVVKVDPNSFDKTKNTIKRLIRNFGSSGGALLSKDVEAQLLQAANSDGNIFFKLKETLANSINQLLLGQTASSGDSSGLSGGDAQSKVRQDILEADCRRISRTINAQLLVPWTKANYGDEQLAPKFVLNCVPPEDTLALAQTLSALATAGFEPDATEMSERFGMTLKKRMDMSDMSDRSDQSDVLSLSDSQLDSVIAKRYFGSYEAIDEMSEADIAKCLEALASSEHINVGSLASKLQKELATGFVEGAK